MRHDDSPSASEPDDQPLSVSQREILEALARHWELLRWRCRDGAQRWHMGDMEVDGRSVAGLLRRGLVEPGGTYAGGQLVLTTPAGPAHDGAEGAGA